MPSDNITTYSALKLKIILEGVDIEAVLDTAALSVLPHHLFKQLPHHIRRSIRKSALPRLVGVTNHSLSPIGSVRANFTTSTGNTIYPIDLIVTLNGPPRLLIGGPFICNEIKSIGISSNTVHFRSGETAEVIPFQPINAHVYVVRISNVIAGGKHYPADRYEKQRDEDTHHSAVERWYNDKKGMAVHRPAQANTQVLPRPLADAGDWVLQHIGTTPACNEQQRNQFKALLIKHHEAFSKGDYDIGEYRDGEITIKLTDETPFMAPLYRIPHHLLPAAKKIIYDWVDRGIAEPGDTCWTSPVFCIMKKELDEHGSPKVRMIVDSRKLNSVNHRTAMPVDDFQESLDAAAQFTIFNALDCSSG